MIEFLLVVIAGCPALRFLKGGMLRPRLVIL